MSTEHQRYSTENQATTIAEYAARHGMRIVRTYEDAGNRHTDCPFATTPTTRGDFWQQKFSSNLTRDRRNLDALATAGWEPIVIWECELKRDSALDELYWRVRAKAHSRP
jgi:hypothetical protein